MRRDLLLALLGLACGIPDDAAAQAKLPKHEIARRKRARAPSDFSLLARGTFSSSVATGNAISGVTHARTSAVQCRNASDELVSLASGAPCLESDGLRVENAGTNYARQSATLDEATWFLTRATITADAATAPDGTSTAEHLQSDASTGTHGMGQNVNTGGPSGPWTFSFYAKAGTASFVRISGGTLGRDAVFNLGVGIPSVTQAGDEEPLSWMVDAGNGWYRCGLVFADGPSFMQTSIGRTAAETQGGFTAEGIGLYLWGAHAEPTVYMTSHAPTTTGAVARSAVTASVTNPLADGASSWCLRATVTPDGDVWDDAQLARGILQLGDTAGAANTASLSTDSAGHVVFSVVDGAGDAKTLTTTRILWAGQRVVRACNDAGTLSVSMDTTQLAGAVTGDGTGILGSKPTSLYLGSLGAASRLNGRIMDICAGASATSCAAAGAVRTPTYVANTLRAMGDSLTNGPGVTSWPAVLDTATVLTATNDAVGGKTAVYHMDRWATVTRAALPQYVSVMTGINDVSLALSSVRVSWMFSKRILDQAATDGAVPILITPSPFKGSVPWDEPRQASLDTLMGYYRAWCTATGAPCYDAAVDLADDVDPLALEAVYDLSDHIHLSQTAHDRIAAQVQAALGL